jgi:hypothetical protein
MPATREELEKLVESGEISLKCALDMCYSEIEFQKDRVKFYKDLRV